MEKKICPKCCSEKPLTEFHKNKNTASGVVSRCKDCTSEYYKFQRKEQQAYARRYYMSHKEEAREYYQNRKAFLKKERFVKMLAKKYNLSLMKYDQMLLSGCGLCHTMPGDGEYYKIDYCRKDGGIRAALCPECYELVNTLPDLPKVREYIANTPYVQYALTLAEDDL